MDLCLRSMNGLRKLWVVWIALLLAPPIGYGFQDREDYSLEQVKGILGLPVSSSAVEKVLNRLGDRVSIALMKIYSQQELENPEKVRRYLPMIVTAFQALSIVPVDDREPRITLPLLKSVEPQLQDPQLRADVLKAEEAVQRPTETIYSIGKIKELLKLPPGSSTGIADKILGRMGDRASIAITKIYTEQELQNPDNMRRYLPMLVMAFQAPDLVAPQDREPSVTNFLLGFLDAHTSDSHLRAEILNTQATVRKASASAP
jgi:hypothetical protein